MPGVRFHQLWTIEVAPRVANSQNLRQVNPVLLD
jgi:hypothetical protein